MPNFTLYDLEPLFLTRVKAKAATEGATLTAVIIRLLTAWLGVAVLAVLTIACGYQNPTVPTVTPIVQVATTLTLTATAGTGQVFMVATLKDATGHGMSAPVTFATSSGTMQPVTVTSGTDGLAQSKVMTTSVAMITATAGAVVGQMQVTPTAAVVIPPQTPDPIPPPLPPVPPPQNPAPPAPPAPPPPSIQLAPITTTVGVSTLFSVGSTMSNTPIASETWAFGDGSTAQIVGTITAHTYSTAGTYTASVTAIDTLGRSAATSTPVIVAAAPPPPVPPAAPVLGASLTCTVPAPATSNQNRTVPCTAVATFGGDTLPSDAIDTVAWDFGDGFTITTSKPTAPVFAHPYANAGNYTVFVTVTVNPATAPGTNQARTSKALVVP